MNKSTSREEKEKENYASISSEIKRNMPSGIILYDSYSQIASAKKKDFLVH
jgi:hypothetical protein